MMKKYTAIILSLCAALAFSACGRGGAEPETISEAAENTTSQLSVQTTLAGTTSAQPEKTVSPEEKTNPAQKAEYIEAYTNLLVNISKEIPEITDAASARFALVYIDDDAIPELVVSEGEGVTDACILFTFRGGKAVNLGPFGGNGKLTYYEKTGVIIDGYGNNGHYVEAVYVLKDGAAALVCEGEIETDQSGKTYFIDGVEVTEKEYAQAKAKFVPQGAKESLSEYKNCHKITKTDIEKIIK